MPICIPDEQEIDPFRVIRQKPVSPQIVPKHGFEISTRSFSRHLAEAGSGPGLRIAFDDEGARRRVEFVRVRGKHARLGFAKGKRQPVEKLMCSVPDVSVGPRAEVGAKFSGEGLSHRAIDAVSADEQIAITPERFQIANFGPETDFDPELFAPPLQNPEQPEARNTREAVAVN